MKKLFTVQNVLRKRSSAYFSEAICSSLTNNDRRLVDAVAGEERVLWPLVVRLEAQADGELGVVSRHRRREDDGRPLGVLVQRLLVLDGDARDLLLARRDLLLRRVLGGGRRRRRRRRRVRVEHLAHAQPALHAEAGQEEDQLLLRRLRRN